jgi:helix-turn-helix protein
MNRYPLKTLDVMRQLGICRESVIALAQSGALRGKQFRKRGHWHFRQEDIDSFLEHDSNARAA